MNKTVTINLGGLVFHIDENAYDVLKKYIQLLKQHFSTSDGGEEIIADIEARIGEMFHAKLKENREVIELSDVEEVINKMGKPEEFAEATQPSGKSSSQNYTEIPTKKRLFRHPDDKILGGVCGGISAYFDIDPIWMRLAFACAFFVMGWGFLLYIILWIIIPKARTTAEKLQMRGEPVNVDNIQRTIREEMGEIKEQVKGFAEKAGNVVKDGRTRNFVQRIVGFIEELATVIVRVLSKFIAVIFIIISLIILCTLFCILTGSYDVLSGDMVMNGHTNSIKELFFSSGTSCIMALIGGSLVLGLPVFMLLYKGARILFGVKNKIKYLSMAAMLLWFLGLIILGFVYINEMTNYRKSFSITQKRPIIQPKGNTLYVELNDSNINKHFYIGWHSGIFTYNNDNDMVKGPLNISFDVVKSRSDSFELIQVNSARGKNNADALNYAENIAYSYSQNDSILLLNANYSWGQGNRFRAQRVRLILKVPVGKEVYLGQNTEHIIYDIKNVTDIYDGDMPGHKWIMTAQGLSCIDCEDWNMRNKPYHKNRHHNKNDDNDEN